MYLLLILCVFLSPEITLYVFFSNNKQWVNNKISLLFFDKTVNLARVRIF